MVEYNLVVLSIWASKVVLVARNPPANSGDIRDSGSIPGFGRAAGGGMVTHSSILAWKIPWTEEPGGATVHGAAEEPDMI